MELVENTMDVSLDTFLERPLFCFVATTSETGEPRVSPLWYLWEGDSLWLLGDAVGRSYVDRLERTTSAAVAIVDFDVTTGRVQHVGMRGVPTVEPLDEERLQRQLSRYLGDDPDEWDERFRELDPARWRYVRIEPETVVMRDQSFAPSLAPSEVGR